MISLSQQLFKDRLTQEMPTDSNVNSLSRQQMVQQQCKLKRFFWQKVLNSFLMFFVTQVVSLSVISNGWKILITSGQEECKENGKKKPEKIFWKSFLKPPEWTLKKLIENYSFKVLNKEILSMLVWKKLWVLLLMKLLPHLKLKILI